MTGPVPVCGGRPVRRSVRVVFIVVAGRPTANEVPTEADPTNLGRDHITASNITQVPITEAL